MPVLKIENLRFSYGQRPLLRDVTLNLEEGEIAALIGSSGSGKTTLFKLITGILQPDSGHLSIAGNLLPHAQSSIAYMTQADLLLPWRKVIDNLTLPFELGRASQPYLHAAVNDLLQELDLSHTADLFPNQLSGGMRQRISLARTLLQQRPLVLLDEPFGSLDLLTKESMYHLLRQKQARGQSLLMVTHDFRDAQALADRIFLLAEGMIAQEWRITPQMRTDIQAADQLQNAMRAALAISSYEHSSH